MVLSADVLACAGMVAGGFREHTGGGGCSSDGDMIEMRAMT